MKPKTAVFSKTVDAKQWNKICNQENNYPNIRSIKRLILEQESMVSKNFSEFEKLIESRQNPKKAKLEFDLEWFLTWRIKFVVYRTCLWCDGVGIIGLKQLREREYFLLTKVWLGPESNANKLLKCRMSGTIKINKNFDKLMNYEFEIDYQNDKILVRK